MKYFESADQLKTLMDSKAKTVLYFSAAWCGPCKSLSPIMEDVSQEFDDRLNIVKVDVDKASELVAQHGIRSVPTLLLLDEGKVVDSKVGAVPKQYVTQWLSSQL